MQRYKAIKYLFILGSDESLDHCNNVQIHICHYIIRKEQNKKKGVSEIRAAQKRRVYSKNGPLIMLPNFAIQNKRAWC